MFTLVIGCAEMAAKGKDLAQIAAKSKDLGQT